MIVIFIGLPKFWKDGMDVEIMKMSCLITIYNIQIDRKEKYVFTHQICLPSCKL